MLHQPEYLRHGLLRNGERLNQNSHIFQIGWHKSYISLVIYHKLGHETVSFLDTTLGKVSCIAKVLVLRTTGETTRMMTGTPYRWHDQITRFHELDGRTNFLDLGKRFMSDYEVVISRWRCP